MSSGLTYYFASQSLMVNFGKPYIWKMSFMNNKNTKSSCFFKMDDFKSSSLCKCIYKLIAKIITNMIRGIFSTIVSSEQFDFLEGCHIHDAIGITQEALHKFKMKHLLAFIIKLTSPKHMTRSIGPTLGFLCYRLVFIYIL